ncbi:MAG: NGG1p interacting factor NIF3 [Lentisphaeria bacterium]|nr:NGG1p interacting factor NIF3 [Lentisphaeria bacterium]
MEYYRLDVYVPESHVEPVKDAMFSAGAGRLGKYENCCFQFCGTGQFRPVAGADPFIGKVGEIEYVQEWKLEMICPENVLRPVIAALKTAHPYETPAFQFWKVALDL